jgi:hypothetical protein
MLFFVWNIWMYEKMKCITYLLKFSNADCNGSGFTMTKTLFSVQIGCSPMMSESCSQSEGEIHVYTQGM